MMAVTQVRAADVYQQTVGQAALIPDGHNESGRAEERRESGPAVVSEISEEARAGADNDRNLAREPAVEGQGRQQAARIDAYI